MLKEHGIEHTYREYTKEPLSRAELVEVFGLLGVAPAKMLRKADAANKALGLTGREDDAVILDAMAAHPTLLQRPIGLYDGRAVNGRPIERLLELVGAG